MKTIRLQAFGRAATAGGLLLLLTSTSIGFAQGSAQLEAPFDMTGYWAAVVTEDWRWRMVVPPKGDYTSVPLNDAGRALADQWDPERDRASGQACRAYGAAGLMRLPLRLQISWQADDQLLIETDAGRQSRLLNFSDVVPDGIEPSLQGYSLASWRGDTITRTGSTTESRAHYLEVMTHHMTPGYLRLNGVPYGPNAQLTEYFHQQSAYGSEWLTVTTVVADPDYLTEPFVTSSNFRRVDRRSSGWNPEPCLSRWGPVETAEVASDDR